MAIIINPIQLGKHSQASSSSSAGLKIATVVPPVPRAASTVVPDVPCARPMPSKRVVPFSCFQVVCNCLSLGWAFELFVFRIDFSNVDIYIYIERERYQKLYVFCYICYILYVII